jgi:hypothetical protein
LEKPLKAYRKLLAPSRNWNNDSRGEKFLKDILLMVIFHLSL